MNARYLLALLLVAVAASGARVPSASAAWPGQNGKIVFTTGDTCCDRIWSMNADGSNIDMFWNEGSQFARNLEISPDGQKIVFIAAGFFDNAVITMNLDASDRRFIDGACGFGPQCHVGGATWSPDSTRLVYTLTNGPVDIFTGEPVIPRRREVWVSDAEGTSKLLLSASADADSARWSPDGTEISYLDNGQVYWVAADGSSAPVLATHQFPISRGLTPQSPDGLKTVHTVCCNATPDHSEEIAVANADGSMPQQITFITDDCALPEWQGNCGPAYPGPYPFHPKEVLWQPIPAPDRSGPTCALTEDASTGQPTIEATVQDYGSGLATISLRQQDGMRVMIPSFDRATSDPVLVAAVLAPRQAAGDFTLKLRDVAGNTTTCSSGLPLLGTSSVGPAVDSNPAGLAEAFLVRASAASTLTNLAVYVDRTSQATALIAGIYADNGFRHPGALLASGTLPGPLAPGGWNSIPLPPVALVGGARYWIAILSPAGSGTLRFRDSCCGANGTSPTETSAQASLTTLPATWSRGTRYRNDGPLSAWG